MVPEPVKPCGVCAPQRFLLRSLEAFCPVMHLTSRCLQHQVWQVFHRTHRHRVSPRTRTALLIVRAYGGKQREQLLKGVSVDNRGDVARILEQAERAETTWSTVYTDFYTPPVVADAVQALKLVPDILPTPWGGYHMAERTRIRLSRADMPEEPAAEVLLFFLSYFGSIHGCLAIHKPCSVLAESCIITEIPAYLQILDLGHRLLQSGVTATSHLCSLLQCRQLG